jgi:hypothetical protein
MSVERARRLAPYGTDPSTTALASEWQRLVHLMNR